MRWTFIFLLGLTLLARAEDWVTTDGETYRGVKVVSHDAAFVTIMDEDGGARIPLRTLNPTLQARFGYDAAKAAALEAATEAQDRADRQALRQQQQATPTAAVPTLAPLASTPEPVPAQTTPASPPFDAGVIQNGDFSSGDTGWQGDGVTPRAYAQTHAVNTADPLPKRGLIVALDPNSWTRIFQSFSADQGTSYSINVTYRIASGTTLSTTPADYADISKRIDISGFDNFGSMAVPTGDFYGTVGDPNSNSIAMEVFTPQMGSNAIQTYQHSYPPIPAGGTKTFALAFPPGSGRVEILTVNVTDK
jgi:hypothetical protein